ncbi:MAG: site-specific integrase [Saprospiraceae bacterium]|nr:site-specific integrase [Saprospiraceae bacterium]
MESQTELHIAVFIQYIQAEKRYSPNTIIAYQKDIDLFATFIKSFCLTSVKDVRHIHIRQWIVDQMSDKNTPRSINRRLSCLTTYFKLLQKRGYIEANPMAKVTFPKMQKRLPAIVTERKMEQLLDQIEWSGEYKDVLGRAVVELLYGTGMRRSELTSLTLSSIDFAQAQVRVIGKGNKERIVPMAKNCSIY